MSDSTVTRESLASLIFTRIANQEGRGDKLDRLYTLTLLRDVLQVIDGKGLHPGMVAPPRQ